MSGLQDRDSQRFCIRRCQAQSREKHARFVPATRMILAKTVIPQFQKIDYSPFAVRQLQDDTIVASDAVGQPFLATAGFSRGVVFAGKAGPPTRPRMDAHARESHESDSCAFVSIRG